MKNKKLIVGFFYCLLFCTCTKEVSQVIPTELNDYVSTFFEEANKRGLDIKLRNTNLKIRFSNLQGKNGTCFPSENLIELDSISWQKRSNYDKEWLLYHELGHCVLSRNHLIKVLPRGECESIMSNSENFNCSINFKSHSWRQYYFDELFSTKTVLPNWYNDTIGQLIDTMNINKGVENNFRGDSFFLVMPSIDTEKNFFVSVSFEESAFQSRNLCIIFDDKILNFISTKDFNLGEVKNTKKYFYAGGSNITTDKKINMKIIKKKKYYIFSINDKIIHVMDYEPIIEKVLRINCFSTDNNFKYEIYYFK